MFAEETFVFEDTPEVRELLGPLGEHYVLETLYTITSKEVESVYNLKAYITEEII